MTNMREYYYENKISVYVVLILKILMARFFAYVFTAQENDAQNTEKKMKSLI
ncbi:hypothetical protein DFP94_103118 [Fontibacillus phaseoli]|uniref:Uncharacterized protein n=1 Tax=Fontibacillus phaseoli TaxID=1416533 RepID=A0A369BFS6_9BACL|nr:hypothetical protein DFP94_103118 [Fontibacillus phaseoli]